jgi:hypothetical protein
MSGQQARHRRLRTAAIYAAFAAATILATRPVWSRLVFGFEPSFDDLLLVRCLALF